MKTILTFLGIFISSLIYGQTKYEKDFNEFWSNIYDHYAYFDQQQINWNRVKEIYQPQLKDIAGKNDFIRFLEKVINELHNGHISLNTNLHSSNRIIPTGQDMFVQKIKDRFYITDLRRSSGVALSGLKNGDEVLLFNGKPIKEQLEQFLPKYTTNHSQAMVQYAVNMLFAGTHDVKRTVTISKNGKQINCYPDSAAITFPEALLEQKVLNKTTAYIKINNSLGENKLIEAFDKAVDEFIQYKNLVIDLTETPSGGNTTVARSILGRFIGQPMPYQKHEIDEKEYQTKRMWVEYVLPRKTQFKGNLFVLVGHWTGSMGEGMAIGFDVMKKVKIIGTLMAGLLGAIDGFTLPETNIGFQIPTERLYHVNGTPRENYKPNVLTKNMEETMQFMNSIK